LRFLSTDAFKNIPQAKETVLANGLKVVTEETFHPTATVGLFVNAGSSFETRENNGTAHFLEHLAFKVTFWLFGLLGVLFRCFIRRSPFDVKEGEQKKKKKKSILTLSLPMKRALDVVPESNWKLKLKILVHL